MDTFTLLRDLIAFPTVSSEPNRALIDHCAGLLRSAGAEVKLIEAPGEQKANLFATVGPTDRPGVLLSGHTDVVPVEGQNWTLPAFEVTEADDKLFGRGTTDMKGFVAAAVCAALRAAEYDLQTPLHLALSYDEEVGCLGVRSLIDMLEVAPICPRFCIVGEPTNMAVATGHKGKTAARMVCKGREGHSALAPSALNALHLACDMVSQIRGLQNELANEGAQDPAYDVPYSTVHLGRLSGGLALNIVPNHAEGQFEIRNLAQDDPTELLAQLRDRAQALVAPLQAQFPEAEISLEVTGGYPGLETPAVSEVVQFVTSLTGGNGTTKVAFGTEAGLFSSRLGIPTVVCGPGSMEQGHKPDEFIMRSQLDRCDTMLEALVRQLRVGL